MSKLKITAAPFDRSSESVISMQVDMLIALSLVVISSCIVYGVQAFVIYLMAVAGSFLIEFVWNGIGENKWKIYDLSSIITGILFACLMPINIPTLAVFFGAMFANGCIKVLFGGIGKNFANPAAMGALMVHFILGGLTQYIGAGVTNNMLENPLVLLQQNTPFTWEVFYHLALGNVQGSIGGVMLVMAIIGLVYLLARKTISWRAFVPALVSFVLVTMLFKGVVCLPYYLCAGNFLFVSVFMLQDPSTSPNSAVSTMVYGVVYGVMSSILLCVSSLQNISCVVALLTANICVPLLEKALYPKYARGKSA